MKCLVTAGPTYEPLDEVRRLTNFSTGRLGSELANFLIARGHEVILLLSEQSVYRGEQKAQRIERFGTGRDLSDRLQVWRGSAVDSVFHAAAVTDFRFGKIWERTPHADLAEVKSGKIPSHKTDLMVQLVSAPKIIRQLRGWFPGARIIGWKYEVEGTRQETLEQGRRQITENQIDACVVNGRGYGAGFGLMPAKGECVHLGNSRALFLALAELIGG